MRPTRLLLMTFAWNDLKWSSDIESGKGIYGMFLTQFPFFLHYFQQVADTGILPENYDLAIYKNMRRLYVIVCSVSDRFCNSYRWNCMGSGRGWCAAFIYRDCFCHFDWHRHIESGVTYPN